MIDQIIINDKASFDDFGASVALRNIKQPTKKEIKETVPFSNVTYDFTAINGEIYWNERELEYVFEMIAPTPEKLFEMKADFANWVMNVIKQELHDPVIPDYHFEVTYSDMSFEDDESLEKTTATVIFTAYPYKIANYPRVYKFDVPESGSATLYIPNNSSHRIIPKISFTEEIDGQTITYDVSSAFAAYYSLEPGMNKHVMNYLPQLRAVTFTFYEEVF